MASALTDNDFKYQKIWLNAVLKPNLVIPICFKKDTSYKCRCIDQTYGRPDPSCRLCFGTGYTTQDQIENRAWVVALTAPLDRETIQKYSLGNFLKSSRMLLISYPVSPEFTKLYEIPSIMKLKTADDEEVNANVGWIVQPDDQEATISFKEKLWNGILWEVKELNFHVVGVDSYKVSEFPIGQKVIIQQTNSVPSKQRFIPKE